MLGIDLKDKTAVVTGGSRGVGRAVAQLLAQAGVHVGISYRSRKEEADAVVADLERAGVRAWAHGGDLSDGTAAEQLFQRAQKEFGSLDIFVGNAGIWEPVDAPIAQMTDEQWHNTIAINLDSVFYTTRAAARMMNDGGSIVLISSTAGQRGENGHADYAATKGAIISIVKGVAIELAPRQITVNAVAPGWIDTEMCELPYSKGGRARIEANIPLRRVAAAEDVAGPVLFLCSSFARYITGEILNVNGGMVLCG